jgi:hypothetical protein
MLHFNLSMLVDRPVLDATGLNGRYAIKLSWDPPNSTSGPTIFQAVVDQLGLRLKPERGTIPMVIVDHIASALPIEGNMSWIGRKRLALVPVYRPHARPPDVIPPSWRDQIFARALFDPDPVTKMDRSLRAYIHTVSSGLADLDAMVLDMQTVDQQDVPPGILEPQLGPQLR